MNPGYKALSLDKVLVLFLISKGAAIDMNDQAGSLPLDYVTEEETRDMYLR